MARRCHCEHRGGSEDHGGNRGADAPAPDQVPRCLSYDCETLHCVPLSSVMREDDCRSEAGLVEANSTRSCPIGLI